VILIVFLYLVDLRVVTVKVVCFPLIGEYYWRLILQKNATHKKDPDIKPKKYPSHRIHLETQQIWKMQGLITPPKVNYSSKLIIKGIKII
jgi:hypothetical protein